MNQLPERPISEDSVPDDRYPAWVSLLIFVGGSIACWVVFGWMCSEGFARLMALYTSMGDGA